MREAAGGHQPTAAEPPLYYMEKTRYVIWYADGVVGWCGVVDVFYG